VGTLLAVSFG
jgi:bifunctional polynucleotide phosphatase/kinase